MATVKMLKGLAVITTSPYGVFVSEKQVRGKFIIHLAKLDQSEIAEGTRLSENGLNVLATVIKSWHVATKQEVNEVIDRIVADWTKSKKIQDAVKAA